MVTISKLLTSHLGVVSLARRTNDTNQFAMTGHSNKDIFKLLNVFPGKSSLLP